MQDTVAETRAAQLEYYNQLIAAGRTPEEALATTRDHFYDPTFEPRSIFKRVPLWGWAVIGVAALAVGGYGLAKIPMPDYGGDDDDDEDLGYEPDEHNERASKARASAQRMIQRTHEQLAEGDCVNAIRSAAHAQAAAVEASDEAQAAGGGMRNSDPLLGSARRALDASIKKCVLVLPKRNAGGFINDLGAAPKRNRPKAPARRAAPKPAAPKTPRGKKTKTVTTASSKVVTTVLAGLKRAEKDCC